MLLGKESNMKSPTAGAGAPAAPAMTNTSEGEKKSVINQELWQACAGPLVNLPAAGTHVFYFPQGHSEQVAASMKKDVDAQIPNYPNLPSKLLCLLHSVTLHADPETDEVYAQMTLQPVPSYDRDALLRSDLSSKSNKPQTEFFCKTLTASDTSTHGGFSVPRRAAEKIFPALDFTMQPPAQELMARDLHDNVWTFRHIYRGQPKRHLLTTGWSLFVSGKRLFAGDSVLFIRDDKQQLLLGIRRANRQPTNLSSSVLSSDSMHIGILAAAAHAAANNSPFTVFYNPRASPSEFVIPLAKYYKAVCSNQISLGMRFRMMFETEESGTRRYMGTITGISDLDPVRWKNSQWRNLQVGWDESTAGERRNRVSIWEIEPVTAPFFICPTPSFFRPKRPRQPGMPDDDLSDLDSLFKRTMPWLGDDFGMKDPQCLPGLSLVQWMNMQQQNNPPLDNASQPNYMQPLHNLSSADISRQLSLPPPQLPQQQNVMPFNAQRPPQQQQQQQMQQLDQLQKLPSAANMNPMNSVVQPHQQLNDLSQQNPRQNLVGQSYPAIQAQSQQGQLLPGQNLVHVQNGVQQQSPSHLQFQRNVPQNLPSSQPQQPPNMSQNQQQNELMSQHLNFPDNQIQMQLLQKLHHQQQSMLAQQSPMQQQQPPLLNDQQKQLADAPQSFSQSITSSQTQDTSQTPSTAPQQMTRGSSQNNLRFTQPYHQPKLQHQQPGVLQELHGQFGQPLPPATNQLSAAGGQSAITDDIPSCSTSPSTNNCQNGVQQAMNGRIHHPATMNDDLAHPPAPLLNSTGLENMSGSGNFVKDLLSKSDVKPSVNIAKNHNPGQGFFGHQPYLNASGAQLEYLDSSSSATSVCLSQNDGNLPHAKNQMSFNSQPVLFRDASQEVQVDPRHNVSFGANMDNQFGMPMMPESVTPKSFSSNLDAGAGLIPGFDNAKEAQPELSSSMVSQSFGVPDMTFNSIDSTINDNSFMNRGTWGAPQLPRLRTFTKVYKRGAVGRSIDIARYSGYEELKQDLARRFGIEGQLEDRQRIGWKLVYVDHENDVLLVGDDPWEEFVNCVRCIKILSPQEVAQMSLDGDIGNNVIPPHQACSSSDGGNV